MDLVGTLGFIAKLLKLSARVQLSHFVQVVLLDQTLIDDRVQGVPHLVRNRRVHQSCILLLCLDIIIENLLGNVDEL